MAGDGARPLYAVLGVAPDASAAIVKQAYRKLALEHHPDKRRGSDGEAEVEATFARIAFAYEVLGHEQRRKRYDLSGEVPQSDSAIGRSAQETFLKEYMRAAPQVSRAATQADMSLHSLENYEVLEVDGRDVPEYMRGIVGCGLGYLAAVVEGMESKEVVLLRHFVMDQMYALLAYDPPLDADAFGGDRGYVITYYDHPLQSGIAASWSDQNGPTGRSKGAFAEMRTVDAATVERRRLAALEWSAPPGTTGAPPVGQQASSPSKPAHVPGEGLSSERLLLAATALARREPELGSFTIGRLRTDLEELLGLEAGGLKAIGSSKLMGMVLQASDELEEEGEDDARGAAETAPVSDRGNSLAEPSQEAMLTPAGAAAVAPATEAPSMSPSLQPANVGEADPCCGEIVVPLWRRLVGDARKLLKGRL
eukprot:TRINITY_DN87261_c0_g1_i1.p1 TRINITY_DN87261_c0_g1~~TRINITY_DN87261_c0_g1_i1.p1  ORF type:complete len:423 (+),score=83.93 TRINITY_DN87261_c0_g1_i1:22-1290(+)